MSSGRGGRLQAVFGGGWWHGFLALAATTVASIAAYLVAVRIKALRRLPLIRRIRGTERLREVTVGVITGLLTALITFPIFYSPGSGPSLPDPALLPTGSVVRAADGSTPTGVIIEGAFIAFRGGDELTGAGYGDQRVIDVDGALIAKMPRRPPDGTLVQGVGPGGLTPAAILVGGKVMAFAGQDEVYASGYQSRRVSFVPPRAFNGWLGVPSDGTLLRSPDSSDVWQVVHGRRVWVALDEVPRAPIWTVPYRELTARIPPDPARDHRVYPSPAETWCTSAVGPRSDGYSPCLEASRTRHLVWAHANANGPLSTQTVLVRRCQATAARPWQANDSQCALEAQSHEDTTDLHVATPGLYQACASASFSDGWQPTFVCTDLIRL